MRNKILCFLLILTLCFTMSAPVSAVVQEGEKLDAQFACG